VEREAAAESHDDAPLALLDWCRTRWWVAFVILVLIAVSLGAWRGFHCTSRVGRAGALQKRDQPRKVP